MRTLIICAVLFFACLGAKAAGAPEQTQLSPAPQNVQALTALGEVWAFLKYHHPAVTAGKYDWDAELIKEIPGIETAKNKTALQAELERWVDKYPASDTCKKHAPEVNKADIKLLPDYGDIFAPGFLTSSLQAKLHAIRDNDCIKATHYVYSAPNGNPDFQNENAYAEMSCPDRNYRLLALFRYWGAIEYFYPYRYLVGEDWKKVLPANIPVFLNAKNADEYMLACRYLVTKIHDSHSWVWKGSGPYFDTMGDAYPAFSAQFIDGKLVVTKTCFIFGRKVSVGDVITHIDGESIVNRVKRLSEMVPASNNSVFMRDIGHFILLTKNNTMTFTVLHGNETREVSMRSYKMKSWAAKTIWKYFHRWKNTKGYEVIDDNIGYVYAAKYHDSELSNMKKSFRATKGIIIDMRCYPSEFMPFTFGAYIKDTSTPFVHTTRIDTDMPGRFIFSKPTYNGGGNDSYKGKIVVLVNEETQSQAEYSVMAFQSAKNVTVIGSTTAGADGNTSNISLPGGLVATFSGLGFYYPDGSETQRVGVKIDVQVKPTLAGVLAGRDEVLEKAIEIIKSK
jgi:hypothetical protein